MAATNTAQRTVLAQADPTRPPVISPPKQQPVRTPIVSKDAPKQARALPHVIAVPCENPFMLLASASPPSTSPAEAVSLADSASQQSIGLQPSADVREQHTLSAKNVHIAKSHQTQSHCQVDLQDQALCQIDQDAELHANKESTIMAVHSTPLVNGMLQPDIKQPLQLPGNASPGSDKLHDDANVVTPPPNGSASETMHQSSAVRVQHKGHDSDVVAVISRPSAFIHTMVEAARHKDSLQFTVDVEEIMSNQRPGTQAATLPNWLAIFDDATQTMYGCWEAMWQVKDAHDGGCIKVRG